MESKEKLPSVKAIQKLSPKQIFARAYAMEGVLNHLNISKNDPRKRERLRVMTALSYITKLIEIGETKYEDK